ncbi:hypothetical protein ScPMuIL_007732 [Solemya velum]
MPVGRMAGPVPGQNILLLSKSHFYSAKVMDENGKASVEERWVQNSRLQKYIRPHSAKLKSSDNAFRVASPTRARRPVTAHPKIRSEIRHSKRVTRQHLKRSHLKPPARSSSSSPKSPESVVITAISLDNTLEENSLASNEQVSLTDRFSGRWAVRSEKVKEKTSPPKRASKPRHSLLSYPAENDDDYDTDLEADVQKLTSIGKKKADPTGRIRFEEECVENGIVPVTYLKRHLGDRALRMRHHYLAGPVTRALASAFKENTITENLDLCDNYLQAEGSISISKMLMENTFITCLNISNNFIQSDGVAAIAEMLEVNTTLKSLNLAGNQLTDQDAKLFIPALKNNLSLISLDLSNNEFGEQGGIFLAGALSVNESLVNVDLSWNSIRGKGAVAVAQSLTNNLTLEVLDLSWNGFSMAGAKALEQALRINVKLKVLDLMNNRLDNKATEKLAIGIRRNIGLETLNLNMNPMGEEGMAAMLKAVTVHPCIKILSMEETQISAKNFQLIKELTDKGMAVLHGGVGGSLASLLNLLKRFVVESRTDLEMALRMQDKDKSGIISSEELKTALTDAGFRVTNRQMEMLLDEIDCSHIGNIKYKEILSGEAMSQLKLQKPSRMIAIATRNDKTSLPVQVRRELHLVLHFCHNRCEGGWERAFKNEVLGLPSGISQSDTITESE